MTIPIRDDFTYLQKCGIYKLQIGFNSVSLMILLIIFTFI